MNKVRDRVYLAPSTATGTELRNAIRKERRLELALENNRLYDLRRWKDDNGKSAICNVRDRMVHLLPIIRLVMIRMKVVTKKRIVIKVSISRRAEMNFSPCLQRK